MVTIGHRGPVVAGPYATYEIAVMVRDGMRRPWRMVWRRQRYWVVPADPPITGYAALMTDSGYRPPSSRWTANRIASIAILLILAAAVLSAVLALVLR